MKLIARLLLMATIFSCAVLKADIDEEDLGAESIIPSLEKPKIPGPFKLEGSFDAIARANVEHKHKFPGGHRIEFGEAEAETGLIFYYNKACKTAVSFDVSYNWTYLHWIDNPFFTKKKFNMVTFSLSTISKRLSRWLWRAQISVNIDADHWELSHYANYDLLLWGRYEYCPHVGVNIGFLAQTGMKIDHLLPIIGVDWKINPKWDLNLVFPVNLALVYHFNERWSAALAARAFLFRDRVGPHEHLRKGTVEYRNAGIELGAYYDLDHAIKANLHAGYSVGGRLKVANQHHHHPHHFNFYPAPYVGGELVVRF